MQNPFYFGKEVAGEAFTDRKQEIKELVADIKQGINVIVYSPRRYGKTSLIKKVLEMVKRDGLLTFYLDLFPLTNLKDFIRIYAEALAAAEAPSKFKGFIKLIEKALPRLLPKIVIKPREGPEISFDFGGIFGEKEPILQDLLEAPYRIAKSKGKKAVVVFDEFQEIAKLEEADKIERELRTRFQKHLNISYVFLGSKRHLMQEMFRNKNRPLYNCGRHFPLGKIPPFDFTVYIQRQFAKSNFKIEQKEIKQSLNITECHPYYTQLFCHLLWDRCLEKKKVASKDIEKVLIDLLREEENAYAALWEDLYGAQRALLKALASDETLSLYSHEFLIKYGLRSVSSIQKAVRSLEKKEIIERSNGHRIISDLFLKKWIKQL